MVTAVRIYVEGGGEGKNSKLYFRHGLQEFFKEAVAIARRKKIGWDITACGSRNDAHGDFNNDNFLDDPNSAVLLLIDSEGPVADGHTPKQHLQSRDHWNLQQCREDQCHLMVQMMESWFLTDVDALAKYYGAGFRRNSIPRKRDVEQIPKREVARALENATRSVLKGPYHKGQHSHQLLKLIDPAKVRRRAYHCKELFKMLATSLGERSSIFP
jgi:hypothetical protein